MRVHEVVIATFFVYSTVECVLPKKLVIWKKKMSNKGSDAFFQKKNISSMGQSVYDLAEEFKMADAKLPTELETIKAMQEKTSQEMSQNEKLLRQAEIEAKTDTRATICDEPKYERDYTKDCPENWSLNKDGSCRSNSLPPRCLGTVYMSLFSEDDKKKFEHRCCAFFPKKATPTAEPVDLSKMTKRQRKRYYETHASEKQLRGPVDAKSGHIVVSR